MMGFNIDHLRYPCRTHSSVQVQSVLTAHYIIDVQFLYRQRTPPQKNTCISPQLPNHHPADTIDCHPPTFPAVGGHETCVGIALETILGAARDQKENQGGNGGYRKVKICAQIAQKGYRRCTVVNRLIFIVILHTSSDYQVKSHSFYQSAHI